MKEEQIRQLIENRIIEDGLIETGIEGVQIFRGSEPFCSTPAVYSPSVIAIISGAKEAVLNNQSYIYDNCRYMCCTMPLPMKVGSPTTSAENPILGVNITLDTKIMTELTLEVANAAHAIHKPKSGPLPQGMVLAKWDDAFTESLLRILQLGDNNANTAVLGKGRLKELYYAILAGDAGDAVRRAFGVGNEIARSLIHVSAHLEEHITIEDMARQVGMSRAVFHRRFKETTTMSPMQYVKSMRLNKAALMINSGMNIHDAAEEVGYVSPSQFSREFKRMYGQSPKQWSYDNQLANMITV